MRIKPRTPKAKIVFAVLGLASTLLLIMLLTITAKLIIGPSPKPSATTQAESGVGADALLAMFESNEVMAQNSFGSSPLIVTGNVGTVDLTPANDLVITLMSSNGATLATATMLQSAWPETANLSRAEPISLRCGTVTLANSSLVLNNCRLTRHVHG